MPKATVEQQAADLANAIGFLRANAAKEGLDPNRIVLMGHSAGAHLAALLGTDPQYLAAARVPLSAVRGVVLLDGAGYDVARQANSGPAIVKGRYEAAFSGDPKRQAALSPLSHAVAPNAANWLILPVASRADSRSQAQGLADALSKAGARVVVKAVPQETHMTLNRSLGEPTNNATADVERFLASLR